MQYCFNCRKEYGFPMGKYIEKRICDMCGEEHQCFIVLSQFVFPPKYSSNPLALELYEKAKNRENN